MAQAKTQLAVEAIDAAEFEHGKDPDYEAVRDFYTFRLSAQQRSAFADISDFWAALLFRVNPDSNWLRRAAS